jgi:MoaA/NifB/PqqE/SkfB family radical SAM enzyme
MPDTADIGRDRASAYSREWSHQCLGGKSFAFIDAEGNIRVCSGMNQGCSNLRSMSYDFKHIWETSEEFQILRSRQRTCAETRTELVAIQETQSSERE